MYFRIFIVSLLSGILFSANAQDQDPMKIFRHHEILNWQNTTVDNSTRRGDENINVGFYHLSIEVSIDSVYIQGNVLCILTPTISDLDEFTLDLHRSLTVDSISEPCKSFYQEDDKILIQLDKLYKPGEIISLSIYYQGEPVMPGGFKGLRYETHHGNQPIIATLSTPFLAHYWYPCKDGPEDKADSVYIDLKTEDKLVNGLPLVAVSNGLLEGVDFIDGYKISKWRHRYPIVPYYVMLAISNYQLIEDVYIGENGDSLQLDYYVFEEDYSKQEAGVEDIPEAIELFTDLFGPYPFENEKYGMTQLGYYGAIENQTNTITNTMEPSWFMISVHELAHMWFADMITCETWNHAWLNEGFASYAEALWMEHKAGINSYHSYMNSMQYFNGGTLYLENPLDTLNVFTQIIYDKGAWALHMLRGVTGDSLFFESLKNYATDSDFKYQNVITKDLQTTFENTTNMDLNFFFDQWVFDSYFPIYYYNFKQEDDKLIVKIYQAQEETYGYRSVFEMPVPLLVSFEDGSDTTITVWNDKQIQSYELNIDKTVGYVSFDPERWILRWEYYRPDLPVAVPEQYQTPEIYLSPNPTSDILRITTSGSSTKKLAIEI